MHYIDVSGGRNHQPRNRYRCNKCNFVSKTIMDWELYDHNGTYTVCASCYGKPWLQPEPAEPIVSFNR